MKMLGLLSAICLFLSVQAHAQFSVSSEDESAILADQGIANSVDASETTEGFHPGPGPRPGPNPGPGHGGPGPIHGGPGPIHGGPGPIHGGPGPIHGGPGPIHGGPGHPGFGGWHGNPGWHGGGPRPGWHDGWRWDYGFHPFWWTAGVWFPLFVWEVATPRLWWQCTAFDQNHDAFTASAPDQQEAAYDAMYDCGGPEAQQTCYIPAGYCQLRN